MAMMKFCPYDDQELIGFLTKFVCGKPFVECHNIRQVDLYGNKKPCEIFNDSSDVNYFFTQLKRKTVCGKNFNRKVAVGGSWKARDTKKQVHDKKGAVIGFMKTFRFDEENNSEKNIQWTMKEYCLSDIVLKELRQGCQIRHEDYVLCRMRRKVKFCSENRQDGENVVANVKVENLDNVPSFSEDYSQLQESQELGHANANVEVENLDNVPSFSEDHSQLQESQDLGHTNATFSSDQLKILHGGEDFSVDILKDQNHDLDVPSCSSIHGNTKSLVPLQENSAPSDYIQLSNFLNEKEKWCSLVSLLTTESNIYDPISQLPLFIEQEQFYFPMVQDIPSNCANKELLEESRLPMFPEPVQPLTEEELAFFYKPDPEYPHAYI